jgi:integrase
MAKRRGRFEGSVYQRKDGRWCASLTLPRGEDGKRRRRVVYGATRAEAAEKLHTLQVDTRAGRPVDASQITVAQYLRAWIRDVASKRVRATTLIGYERYVGYVCERVGGTPLRDWTPAGVRFLWSELEREGFGARTRQAIHRTIRRALADAVRDGSLAVNPVDAVDSPRTPTPVRQVLAPDEMRTLLDQVDSEENVQLTALVTLLASTGLRIGECLGLRWDDIDLSKCELHVRHSLAEVRGKHILQEPKTEASRRTMPLPARSDERLRSYRRSLGAVPHARMAVFVDRNGRWLRKSNLMRRLWHPLLERAKLPRVGFYALRHGHATALLASGESVVDVSARLGHRDPAITMSVYAHALPDRAREVADRVDELLG